MIFGMLLLHLGSEEVQTHLRFPAHFPDIAGKAYYLFGLEEFYWMLDPYKLFFNLFRW